MLPAVAPAPLEGTALLDLLQETLVGLTGIDTTLVRPRFQAEPPDIPQSGTCWLSFGIERRPADTFPVLIHDPNANGGLGQDNFQRQEALIILCSFYDTGSTGAAYGTAALLRDGLAIPQNNEAWAANNMFVAHVGELTPLPSLLKQQWLFRVDFEFRINRQVDRVYRTENLLTASIDLKANTEGTTIIEDTISVHP